VEWSGIIEWQKEQGDTHIIEVPVGLSTSQYVWVIPKKDTLAHTNKYMFVQVVSQ